jgi:hypothetical protein
VGSEDDGAECWRTSPERHFCCFGAVGVRLIGRQLAMAVAMRNAAWQHRSRRRARGILLEGPCWGGGDGEAWKCRQIIAFFRWRWCWPVRRPPRGFVGFPAPPPCRAAVHQEDGALRGGWAAKKDVAWAHGRMGHPGPHHTVLGDGLRAEEEPTPLCPPLTVPAAALFPHVLLRSLPAHPIPSHPIPSPFHPAHLYPHNFAPLTQPSSSLNTFSSTVKSAISPYRDHSTTIRHNRLFLSTAA